MRCTKGRVTIETRRHAGYSYSGPNAAWAYKSIDTTGMCVLNPLLVLCVDSLQQTCPRTRPIASCLPALLRVVRLRELRHTPWIAAAGQGK